MADFDVVIVGASFGGVAAALAAARYGRSVALIDAGGHVGGQATSQGLNRWDETKHSQSPNTYGSTKLYQTVKDDIRAWYRTHTTLAPGADSPSFNPGYHDKSLHPFSADCGVAETVLRKLLKDVEANVTLMLDSPVTAADVSGGTIHSLTLENGDTVTGKVVIDATDLGELLPLCNVSWFIGAEGKDDTHEPQAEDQENRGYIQPFTVPIAVEHALDGVDHSIQKPAHYDALVASQGFRVYNEKNGWIGGVFSSAHSAHPEWETVFNYRVYIDHRNFSDSNYTTDRTTLNVGSNDYQSALIPTGDAARDAAIVEAGREASIAYLYWLQHDAPRDDGGQGYPSLKPRADIFGRDDGTAPQPYIRESRRISKPLAPANRDGRVLETDIAPAIGVRAPTNWPDSVGIGHYAADVHKCWGPPGTPYKSVDSVGAFQIPLGALIPSDATNYVAGCKNLAVTHLTNGAYRVHPIEWAVGEAAGTLAAYCAGQNVAPAAVYGDGARLAALQLRLLENGAPIFFWDDLSYDHDRKTFAAANLLGVRGYMIDPATMHFRPGDQITQNERNAIDAHHGSALPWPNQGMTRGQAAIWVCSELGLPLP
jgi:hypothetical protein